MNHRRDKKIIEEILIELFEKNIKIVIKCLNKLYCKNKVLTKEKALSIIWNYIPIEVKEFLYDKRKIISVNIDYIKEMYIMEIIDLMDIESLKKLQENDFDFTYDDNFVFKYIADTNNHVVLKFFIENNMIDLSFSDQYLYKSACSSGFFKIIKLLINNKGVHILSFEAIESLIVNKYPKCVSLILKDNRMDPYIKNYIIEKTIDNDNLNILKMIFRNNPFDDLFKYIPLAIKYESYNTLDYLLDKNKKFIKQNIKEYLIKTIEIKNYNFFILFSKYYDFENGELNKDIIMACIKYRNKKIFDFVTKFKDLNIKDRDNEIMKKIYSYSILSHCGKYMYLRMIKNKYICFTNNRYYISKFLVLTNMSDDSVDKTSSYKLFIEPHKLLINSILYDHDDIFKFLCSQMKEVVKYYFPVLSNYIDIVFLNDNNKSFKKWEMYKSILEGIAK